MSLQTQQLISSPVTHSSRKEKLLLESYRPTSSSGINKEMPIFNHPGSTNVGIFFGMADLMDSPSRARILHSLPDERKSRPITGNSPRVIKLGMGKIKKPAVMKDDHLNLYELSQQNIYSPFYLHYNEKGKVFKENVTKNLEKCLNFKKINTTSSPSPKVINSILSSKMPYISPRDSHKNNIFSPQNQQILRTSKSSIVSKHQEPSVDITPYSSKLILSPRNAMSYNLASNNAPTNQKNINENKIVEKFLRKKPSKTQFHQSELPNINAKK